MVDFLNCLRPPAAPAVQVDGIHGARRGLPLAAIANRAPLLLVFFFCFFASSIEAVFSPLHV
jgi:hypothetical protein